MFFSISRSIGEFGRRPRVQQSNSLGLRQIMVDAQQGSTSLSSSDVHRRPAGQYHSGHRQLRQKTKHLQLQKGNSGTHCYVQGGNRMHGSLLRQAPNHLLLTRQLHRSVEALPRSTPPTTQGTNITNLELERQFMNDSLVCSLRPFALRGNYFMVGTKDGRIQIINCLTGETLRKLSVATTPVVEILLF